MAEQQFSAPPRAQHPVPDTEITAGVTHVRHRHTERFTVVGNHLAQHRELSLVAIGIAVHIQSLPDGASITIKCLTSRFHEGEVTIARALRELEAQGYLTRRPERTSTGRCLVRTVFYEKPCGEGPAEPVAREGSVRLNVTTVQRPGPRMASRPATGRAQRPVPERAPGTVPGSPPVPTTPARSPEPTGNTNPSPVPNPDTTPAPSPGPAPNKTPGSGRDSTAAPTPAPAPDLRPHHDEAADVLASLRGRDPRLLLRPREVEGLVPAVAAWFARGVTGEAITRTLIADLPAGDIPFPAALLRYRVVNWLPPALPTPTQAPTPPRPDPLQTCDGCERAFRAPAPGHCQDCRQDRCPTGHRSTGVEPALVTPSVGQPKAAS